MLRRTVGRLAEARRPRAGVGHSAVEVKVLTNGGVVETMEDKARGDLAKHFKDMSAAAGSGVAAAAPQDKKRGLPVLKGSSGSVLRRRHAQQRRDRVAVFVDYCRPSISAESVPIVLKSALNLGTPDIRRAYADYSQHETHRYDTAAVNGFDMIQVHNRRANAQFKPAPSHIRIAIDIAEVVSAKPTVRHVVIASDLARSYQFLSPLLTSQTLWVVVNSFDPSLSCRRIGQIHATTGELLEPSF